MWQQRRVKSILEYGEIHNTSGNRGQLAREFRKKALIALQLHRTAVDVAHTAPVKGMLCIAFGRAQWLILVDY